MTVTFELGGQQFIALNGGPQFKFTEAISMSWTAGRRPRWTSSGRSSADGGEEGPCGWLKDKYGLSWQIVPQGLTDANDPDPAKVQRVMQAMLGMRKIDLAALRDA